MQVVFHILTPLHGHFFMRFVDEMEKRCEAAFKTDI